MPLRNYFNQDEPRGGGDERNNVGRALLGLHGAMDDFYPSWRREMEREQIECGQNWQEELDRQENDPAYEDTLLSAHPEWITNPPFRLLPDENEQYPRDWSRLQGYLEREEAIPAELRGDYRRLVEMALRMRGEADEVRRIRSWAQTVEQREEQNPQRDPEYDRVYARNFDIMRGQAPLSPDFMGSGMAAPYNQMTQIFQMVMEYIWGEGRYRNLPVTAATGHSLLGTFDGTSPTPVFNHFYHYLEGSGIEPASFAEFVGELRNANLRQRRDARDFDEAFMRIGAWRRKDAEAAMEAAGALRAPIREGGQIPAWYDPGQLSENPSEEERAWREASRELRDGIRFMPENAKEVLLANFNRTFDKLFDQDQLRTDGRSVLDHIFVNGQNMGAVMDSRYGHLPDEAENMAKLEVMARILEGEPVDIALGAPDGTVRLIPLRTDAYNPEIRQSLDQNRQREQDLRARIDRDRERTDYLTQMGKAPRRRSDSTLNMGSMSGRLPESYTARLNVYIGPQPDEAKISRMIDLSAIGSGDRIDDRLRNEGARYFDEFVSRLSLGNLEERCLGGQARLYEEMGYRFPVEAYYIDGRPIGEIVAEKYKDQLGVENPDRDIRSASYFEQYAKAEVAAALLSGKHFVNVAQPRVDVNGNYTVDVCDVEADLRPLDGYEGMFRSRRSKLAAERLRKDQGREERREKVRAEAGSRLLTAVNRTLLRQEPYRQAARRFDLMGADTWNQYFTEEERRAMKERGSTVAPLSDGGLPAELQRSNFTAISRLAQLKLMKDHPEVRLADLADPSKFAAEKREAGKAVWDAIRYAASFRQYEDLAGIVKDSMEVINGLDYGKELRYALNQPADIPWESLDGLMRDGEHAATASAFMKSITDFGTGARQAVKGINGGPLISMAYGINASDREEVHSFTDPWTGENRTERIPGVYSELSKIASPDTVRAFERKIDEMDGLLTENHWFRERQGKAVGTDPSYSATDKYEAIARRMIMEKNRSILLSGNGGPKEIPLGNKKIVEHLRDQLMATEQLLKEEKEGSREPIGAKDAGRYLFGTASLEEIDKELRLKPDSLAYHLVEEAFLDDANREWESRKQGIEGANGRIHGLAGVWESERDAAVKSFVPRLVTDNEQYNSLLRIYMMAEKGMSFEQAVNVNKDEKNQIAREFQGALALHLYNNESGPDAGAYYGTLFQKAVDKMADYDMGPGTLHPDNAFSVVRRMEALETFRQTAKDLADMKARVTSDPAFIRGYVQNGGQDLFRCEKGLAIMGNYADKMIALGQKIHDKEVRDAVRPDIRLNMSLFKNNGSSARALAGSLNEEQLDRGARDLKGLVTDLSRTRRPIGELTQSEPSARGRDRRQEDALQRNRQNTNQPVL